MSTIPYDPQRCSVFRPANINEYEPVADQYKIHFFSDIINDAIDVQKSEAGLCAELSRLVYFKFEDGNQSALDNFLVKCDLKCLYPFSEGSTQGIVAEDADRVFLIFRGTETANFVKPNLHQLLQWLWQLRYFGVFGFYAFLKRRRPNPSGSNICQAILDFFADALLIKTDAKTRDINLQGRVHYGFLKAFTGSLDDWESSVRNAIANGKSFVICGHSLGAALAVLAAAHFAEEFHARIRLYTFGCPRVGDQCFVQSLAKISHLRHVDCRDVVTRIPPEFLCYAHHGDEVYINSKGEVSDNPDPSITKSDRSQAFWRYFFTYKNLPFINDNVWLRGIADHAPINYVSGILGLRNSSKN